MVPEAILTALFVGWLLKGKFTRLTDVSIKYVWMVFVPLGMYFASVALNYSHAIPNTSAIFPITHVVGMISLVVLAVANRRIPGAVLMGAGLLVNIVAVVANSGFMPASKNAIAAVYGNDVLKIALAKSSHFVHHSFINAGTNLSYLCDIYAFKRPVFFIIPSVYSIGDIITTLGCVIAIIAIMRNPVFSEKKTAKEV